MIPWAWLPLVLALPWLLPRWREAWREGEAPVLLPLFWSLLVLLFFTLSSGKRGVYILPALPAVCLAAAPYLDGLLDNRWLNRLATAVLGLLALAFAFAFGELSGLAPQKIGIEDDGVMPHLATAAALLGLLAVGFLGLGPRRDRGFVRLAGFLMSLWLVVGWYVMPVLDDERSGARVMESAYELLPRDGRLGITRPKESLILHARGALTNFGHRRPDRDQEVRDARRWTGTLPDPARRGGRSLLLRLGVTRSRLCASPPMAAGRGRERLAGVRRRGRCHDGNPLCCAQAIALAMAMIMTLGRRPR
ncbi:MAG: hypothetical protein P8172_16830 [Gammaproteobacteria bacterium]